METSPNDHRQLALRIASSATDTERLVLQEWAVQLLAIRATSSPALVKAQQAVALTRRSEVVWPTVKILGRQLKRIGWEKRTLTGRLGLGGAAVGMALFGGHGAGIAALGTAIGVPLWVVTGSGAAFAGVLIEELTAKAPRGGRASYTVIDTDKE